MDDATPNPPPLSETAGTRRRRPFCVSIAGITLRIRLSDTTFRLGKNYDRYALSPQDEDVHSCDIKISCRQSHPDFQLDHLKFQIGKTIQSRFLCRAHSYIFKRKKEILITRKDFRTCRFRHASPDYLTEERPVLGTCGWPLLALWGYLSVHGLGTLLHGSLLFLDNRYILLLGDSGAGKSTLSGLAIQQGAECLTDEYPFLRCHDGMPWVYGSPWFSDENLIQETTHSGHSETAGPLAAVFILQHAQKNRLSRLTPTEAGLVFLHNTRAFNWLPHTLAATIDLIDIVINSTPVYSFGFVPRSVAVDSLREAIRK